MKKSLFAIIFLIVIGVNCYGVNDFKILQRPNIDITTSFTIPTIPSLRNEGPSYSSALQLDFYSLSAGAAFNLTVESIDTILDFLIKPLSYRYFEMGVGFKYHLYDYFDSFLENDFMITSDVSYLYRDILRIRINTGYDIKLTCLKNNKLSKPIFYQTLMMGLDVIWNISKSVQFFAGANSMGNYDFALIGTPIYNLGFNFKLLENLVVGFDYNMKMIDMVAVAENISEMLLTLYLKVRL